jgi:hypothetical protein
MSRYDDLRRMREAKFASQQATKVSDATKVAAIPATKSNNATKVKIGRPLISDHPMTNTECSRRHRARQKAAHAAVTTPLRVCPKTSGGIAKFSEHEAD